MADAKHLDPIEEMGGIEGLRLGLATPEPQETQDANAKLPGATVKHAPYSEGNANIPGGKRGYDKGSCDDLASRGALKRQANKGPV